HLLAAFSRSGMTATSGTPESQAERAEVCRFFDERSSAAQKLSFIHATMRRDMKRATAFFERIEGLLASLSEAERQAPSFLLALAEISADDAARARYLAVEQGTAETGLRARMIALAATFGWLTPEQRTAEMGAMIDALLARRSIGFADVAAICTLDAAGELDGALSRIKGAIARDGVAGAAILACLGDRVARGRVFAALASPDERDVQVA